MRLPKPIFLCLLVIFLSACTQQRINDGGEPALQASAEAARLEEAVARQKNRIMQLELRLLARQSEIQRLSSAHDQAVQEIVRVKSKLRSRNSKAENVANLAEVKLALQSAQAVDSGDVQVEAMERAQQYVAMSEVALEERNYDGASYLIGQAKSSLRTSMASPDERSEGNRNTHSFFQPVRMTVTLRCNVRAGPGTDTKILTQLNSGTSVLATGYRELWVQIQTNDEITGWIHYSLLKAGL